MSQILVTGVNGFVGKHLTRALADAGHTVIGVGRESSTHKEIEKLVYKYFKCDLTEAAEVNELPLEKVDAIINLAGLAQVGGSFSDPEKYIAINVAVLAVLGEELLSRNLSTRLVAISTGSVYHNNQSMPLSEDSQLDEFGSPYAVSKLLMEKSALDLRARGIDCVIARPFNHIGPGQEPGFLVPDLYKKIVVSQNSKNPILVGNLKTKRDYTDVRDVVRAYILLAATKVLNFEIYNVCSGKSISGEKVLETMVNAIGQVSTINVEVDPTLLRPTDPIELFGNNARLKNDTGWFPVIDFEKTINDYVGNLK